MKQDEEEDEDEEDDEEEDEDEDEEEFSLLTFKPNCLKKSGYGWTDGWTGGWMDQPRGVGQHFAKWQITVRLKMSPTKLKANFYIFCQSCQKQISFPLKIGWLMSYFCQTFFLALFTHRLQKPGAVTV